MGYVTFYCHWPARVATRRLFAVRIAADIRPAWPECPEHQEVGRYPIPRDVESLIEAELRPDERPAALWFDPDLWQFVAWIYSPDRPQVPAGESIREDWWRSEQIELARRAKK